MDRLELEYALYQDDDFITCGTIKEISEETGISEKNLCYYSFKSYEKKCPNGKRLVRIDMEKISKRQCERFSFMLKQKRIDNKLSRKALSDKLGYSESLIKKWETLEVHPNLYNVEDVATFFNIPINVLIGEK